MGRGGLALRAQMPGCQSLRSLEVKAQVPALLGQVPDPPEAQEARLSPHRRPGPAGLLSRAHAISGRVLPLHPVSSPPTPGPVGTLLRSSEALDRESDPIRSRDGSGGRSRRAPRAGVSSGVACWPEAQTCVGQSWPAPPAAQGRAVSFSGSRRSVVGERGPRGLKPPHSPGQSRAEPRPATCRPRGPSGAGKRRPMDEQGPRRLAVPR